MTSIEGQPAAVAFHKKLERRGIKVIVHEPIAGYPADVERVVSDDGYGSNPFIETSSPLVVVNAPGPNSGKMGTCLSQLYHEYKRGVRAGYAKFETFPIWNLPLRHPVNAAYEAATADLHDVNQIDPFHLDAYSEKAVNYNRDVEAFPLLKRSLEKITGKSLYRSPTDMGVNRAGFAIVDDEGASVGGKQEIIRRYFRYSCDVAMGMEEPDSVARVEALMEEFNVRPQDRSVVAPARAAATSAEKGNRGIFSGAALELPDGQVVTGHNSPLLHASSALIINAIKKLADIPKHLHLLSPSVIESIGKMRREMLRSDSISLNLPETLIALSIGSTTNPIAEQAVAQLPRLRGCELHLTHIPSPGDERGLRQLGVKMTCDPSFASKKLFVS